MYWWASMPIVPTVLRWREAMRVCYLIPMLDYATGWGRWTVDLLEQISDRGVEPVLVLPSSQRSAHEEMGMDRFETHFWGPEPYLRFHTLRSVSIRGLWDLAFLKSHFGKLGRIDLIHAADLHPWGFFGLQMKRKLKVPLLVTNHSKLLFNPRHSLLDYWLCGQTLRNCDRMCSVSAWGSDQIRTAFPDFPSGHFRVIHNGVNPERFPAPKAEMGKRMRENGPVLLSVTRFIRLKNIETSILAFAEVKREFPGAVFHIVGPHTVPAYVERIKNLIREHRLEDVHLAGKTSTVAELIGYYTSADVLVHTPSSESYGLIILEAARYGLPVVATSVGGVPEVIADGENGLLVKPGDYRAVADAVKRILTDSGLASRLAENGRNKAARQTTGKVADDYLALYRETIGGEA